MKNAHHILQNRLFVLSKTAEDVPLPHCRILRQVIIRSQHPLQARVPLVVDSIRQQQHSHVRGVRHRLPLTKHVILQRKAIHSITHLVAPCLASLIHQRNRLRKLLHKVKRPTQRLIAQHLTQRIHHTRAHRLHLRQSTYSITIPLKSLAHQHILNQLPALNTHTLTIKQSPHIHPSHNTGIRKLTYHLTHSPLITIKLTQRLKTTQYTKHTPKSPIIHHLAQLHRLLRLALRLRLASIKLRKRLRRIRQRLIQDKHHTRVLHPLHLFTREAILRPIALQVLHISPIRTLQCSKFPRHRPSVS